MTKGSDEKIEITLLDSADNPIVLSTLYDIQVSCYQEKANILQSWSVRNSSITEEDIPGGIISFILDRKTTQFAPTKRLFLEIDLVTANAAYDGGYEHKLQSNIALTDLQDSTHS